MACESTSTARSSEQLRTPSFCDIDNDILIAEVELREFLYDRTHPDSAYMERKNKGWEEVGEEVFFEVWHYLTEDQKAEACKCLKSRWKILRDGFFRELRELQSTKSGPTAKKKIARGNQRFKRLSFLMNCLEPKVISESVPTPPEGEEGAFGMDYEETLIEQRRRKQMKAFREDRLVEGRQDTSNDVTTTDNSLLERSYETDQEKNFNNSLYERSYEIDQEMSFALSLVPLLKRIPMEKKLATQIKILQVIQSAVDGQFAT